MNVIKKILIFLARPSQWFCFLMHFITLIFIIFSILLINFKYNNIIYIFLGITFFYSAYLVIIYFRTYKERVKSVIFKYRSKYEFIDKLFINYNFRTLIFACFSTIVSLGFATFNMIIGSFYSSIWHESIFFYYALLVLIRFIIIFREYMINKKHKDGEEKIRAKTLIASSCLLLLLDFSLIAPLTLLVLFRKDVILPLYIAIINAAYVFYKITLGIYNYFKVKKNNNYSIIALKNINFIDSMVSILSMTNTMIIVNSENGIDQNMKIVIIVLGFFVFFISIVVTINGLVKGIKYLNKK